MAIKAIIFDCFGVLVMSKIGTLSHDYPELAQEFHDLALRSDYGYLSREQYGQEISRLTGIEVGSFEPKYWHKNIRNESAINWVREIKEAGIYETGLLSNIGRNWLDDFLPAVERRDLFASEVLSSDVGIVKPDPDIFQLMADQLGFEPEECIMIDDVVDNIDGASRIGMKGIVFGNVTDAKVDLDRILRENA